jgi:3-hydroxyisobutyrate dehydrogenase-like beta-hydroxyacid dehydrogenase
MVARLLAAGDSVAVYNRTPAKLARLLEQGAVAVDSPADLAGCPVVFVTVGGDADFEHVILGAGGVAEVAERAPQVIIDATTVSAEISASVRARLAERGIAFLAAAVSGNAKVIRAGLLSIVVSGDRDAFDRVQPYLEALGARVTYAGAGEQARLVKLCHNLYLGMVIEALVEICVLATELGLARADVLEFINGGVMGSGFSRYKSPALVNLDFEPTFTLELLHKDLTLGIGLGDRAGVELPFSNAVRESVARTIADGFAGQDFAALIATRAKASGVELVPENVSVPTGLEPVSVAPSPDPALDRG